MHTLQSVQRLQKGGGQRQSSLSWHGVVKQQLTKINGEGAWTTNDMKSSRKVDKSFVR